MTNRTAKEIVTSSHFGNLLVDGVEIALDQLLKDGLLREIPAIGTAVNMVKLGIDIRNRLFLEKLLRFCQHLQDIPEVERREFIEKLQADEGFRRQVGDNLVLLLDRFDDTQQKPVILGRIFEAYVRGTIDYLTFRKLCTAVDRIKVYNLQSLLDFYDDSSAHKQPDDDTLQDLVLCGLASMVSGIGLVFGDGSSRNIHKNVLGKLFIEIALKESG